MGATAIVHVLSLLCSSLGQTAGTPSQPEPPPNPPAADSESTPLEDAPPTQDYSLATTERVTGSWGGRREWLEDEGLDFALSLTTIYQHNAHGGIRTRNAHRISGSYDLELTFDLDTMCGIQGATMYAYAQGGWDDGVSGRGYVGDLFGVNGDVVGDRSIDVLEAWYEQKFFDDKLRIQVGKINLTNEFLTNAYANDETEQFLNYGLDVPLQVPIPGDAFGHVGAQAVFLPTDWLYIALGAADAQADFRETGFRTALHGEDYFVGLFEFGLSPTLSTARGDHSGNYRFGAWYDPQPKPEFFDDSVEFAGTVPLRRDDVGFYASFDQLLLKESMDMDEDDCQGLGAFFRYGFAHAEVNELEHFWSLGAQYQGPLPTRDNDVIALGVAQGVVSRFVERLGDAPRRETAIELYYKIQVAPWVHVTPDLQMILNPGGRDGAKDALVVGLRVQASF